MKREYKLIRLIESRREYIEKYITDKKYKRNEKSLAGKFFMLILLISFFVFLCYKIPRVKMTEVDQIKNAAARNMERKPDRDILFELFMMNGGK